MGQQIFFPSRTDSRFESQYQHTPPVHPESKLVCRKSLAKTHLGVPEEVRRQPVVMRVAVETEEILRGLAHSLLLFTSHRERAVTAKNSVRPSLDSEDGTLHLRRAALIPLAFELADVAVSEHLMHGMVVKSGTVIAHSRTHQLHLP